MLVLVRCGLHLILSTLALRADVLLKKKKTETVQFFFSRLPGMGTATLVRLALLLGTPRKRFANHDAPAVGRWLPDGTASSVRAGCIIFLYFDIDLSNHEELHHIAGCNNNFLAFLYKNEDEPKSNQFDTVVSTPLSQSIFCILEKDESLYKCFYGYVPWLEVTFWLALVISSKTLDS